MFFRTIATVLTIFMLSTPLPALAVDGITSAIRGIQGSEAGVVGRAISREPSTFAPTTTPGITTPVPDTPAISEEAKKYSFVLRKIKIEGNEAFSTQRLEQIFTPLYNKKITVAKLMELVNDITKKYQTDGYFLSKAFLPPQEIVNGVVQVTVVEGFISDIVVQGLNRQDQIRYIEQYGNRIKSIKPIKLKPLERYLLLINDVQGYTTKSVIEPDPNTPLGSRLTLVTELKTFQLNATHDNFQTPYLGPSETSVNAYANSVFFAGGSIYSRVLTADDRKKLNFYELTYSRAIGSDGLKLIIDGYQTKTNPQFILTPLEIFGKSSDGNISVYYPVIRSRDTNLNFLFRYDYAVNTSRALGVELFRDKIQDFTLNGTFTNTTWKGNNTLTIGLDKGVSNLGEDFFLSRANAIGDFFKVSGLLSRTQFFSNTFSAHVLVTGQYSKNILPSLETFTFGGPYLGRGYDWVQFTGDSGVAGTIELRVNANVDLPLIKQIQYFTFYDAGVLYSNIPFIPRFSGASAGLGARGAMTKHFYLETFFGKPLTTPNASQIVKGKGGHNMLGFFQVIAYL